VRIPRFVAGTLFSSLLFSTGVTAQVPTPESVLGFVPGADFELANYEESVDYFQRLAASSDRMMMIKVGRTSEGRDWWLALVSSPENLREVERYRDIADQIAHPANLDDASALALARSGKAIVDISGGLHASEVAGAQHMIGLAYELVASEEPRIVAIRENVISALWPSLNPDGQTMVADWYRSNVGTPLEVAPMPWLYQKYIGHDNNRDGYMLNMVESRVLSRVWQEWDPQIIHVHHQTAPFPTRIWLPPFAEPIASLAPPLMSRTVNTLGMTMATMLESRGLKGATHMGTGFDAWYPGYVDYLPLLQNQAAYWTETALYRYATPHFYTLADFPASKRDLRPESLYPSPWEGGWWRLGDAVEYMHVASIAVLDYAAKYSEDLLYNRYQSGRDQIAKYEASPPYAYFIHQDQRDPVAPVEMLRRLAFSGIRVHQLTSPVTHEGLTHPVGTWVILLNQEFGELARQVMGVQTYPDLREYPEGPPEQPYDAAGWTLPYQMGVDVITATQPLSAEVRAAMEALSVEATPWDAEVADACVRRDRPPSGRDDRQWLRAPPRSCPEQHVPGAQRRLGCRRVRALLERTVRREWSGRIGSRPPRHRLRSTGFARRHGRHCSPPLSSRPVPPLVTEHGRRMDSVAPRELRLRLHESALRGRTGRRPPLAIRRHRAPVRAPTVTLERLLGGDRARPIRGRTRRRGNPHTRRVRPGRWYARVHERLQ